MPRITLDANLISNLSKDQQIAELNSEVKCVVGPSKIHGVGVFAIRDIIKGDRAYCRPNIKRRFYNVSYGSLNKLFPEIKEIILARWPSIINGSVFQHPNDDLWLLLFMNHSNNPNYDVMTDLALTDIRKGQEVVEDYRTMENAKKVYSWL